MLGACPHSKFRVIPDAFSFFRQSCSFYRCCCCPCWWSTLCTDKWSIGITCNRVLFLVGIFLKHPEVPLISNNVSSFSRKAWQKIARQKHRTTLYCSDFFTPCGLSQDWGQIIQLTGNSPGKSWVEIFHAAGCPSGPRYFQAAFDIFCCWICWVPE